MASARLTSEGLNFAIWYDDFIKTDDYDRFVSDLRNCFEKPDFYKIYPSPGVQILSVPGMLEEEVVNEAAEQPEGTDLKQWLAENAGDEDYYGEPAIIITFYIPDDEGYTPSAVQIALTEEETRKLVSYLESVRERIETVNFIY